MSKAFFPCTLVDVKASGSRERLDPANERSGRGIYNGTARCRLEPWWWWWRCRRRRRCRRWRAGFPVAFPNRAAGACRGTIECPGGVAQPSFCAWPELRTIWTGKIYNLKNRFNSRTGGQDGMKLSRVRFPRTPVVRYSSLGESSGNRFSVRPVVPSRASFYSRIYGP